MTGLLFFEEFLPPGDSRPTYIFNSSIFVSFASDFCSGPRGGPDPFQYKRRKRNGRVQFNR